jgi:magnesium transporter
MVRVYYKEGKDIRKETSLEEIQELEDIVWVDLQNAAEQDEDWIENHFGLSFQTPQEIIEIESSSRYIEREQTIIANSNFLKINTRKEEEAYPVAFQLKNQVLFTLRTGDSRIFADTVRKMKISKEPFVSGADVLLRLFETQIDYEADLVESIARKITQMSRSLHPEKQTDRTSILVINDLQEQTMTLREGIIDKQRVLSAFMRSALFPEDRKDRLKIVLKDISSLLEYTSFNFERLEYLQNTLMNLITLEQNQIIKIFTLFSIVFLPPTLIASIFGMNFTLIPGLDQPFGFYVSLGLMVGSSLGIILYFRNKNWI